MTWPYFQGFSKGSKAVHFTLKWQIDWDVLDDSLQRRNYEEKKRAQELDHIAKAWRTQWKNPF